MYFKCHAEHLKLQTEARDHFYRPEIENRPLLLHPGALLICCFLSVHPYSKRAERGTHWDKTLGSTYSSAHSAILQTVANSVVQIKEVDMTN